MIERGLVIRSPWIDKILAGEKTWEIRDKPTNKSERIALIKGGSGTIVGCATLNKSKGPLSPAEFINSFDKHCVTPQQLAEFYSEKPVYAWLLSDVRKLFPLRSNTNIRAVPFNLFCSARRMYLSSVS